MIRPLAAAALIALSTASASATGGVYCDGVRDKDVAAYLTVGRAPGFAIVGARIGTKDQSWSMIPQDGAQPIVPVQGAVVGDLTIADFADPGYEAVVASLRVLKAENAFDVAAAGVLSIPGVGVWAMVCDIE